MDNRVYDIINSILPNNEVVFASFFGVLFILVIVFLIMRPVVRENALKL